MYKNEGLHWICSASSLSSKAETSVTRRLRSATAASSRMALAQEPHV